MLLNILFLLTFLISLSLIFLIVNHFLKNLLINKIAQFLQKTKQIFIKLSNKWYFWPILFLIIYLFILIVFAIFINPLGSPDCTLYGEGINLGENANIARKFISSISYTPLIIFGVCLILIVLLYFFFKFKRKKLTYIHGILLIVILGSILRLVYGLSTDNIFTRQHDVWSSSGYGHYGITMHIYENFSLPALKNGSLSNSYQMYHPKFAHYIYAFVMRFNSLFLNGNAQWNLYQSVRIFTITISIFTLIISYLILKEVIQNPKGQKVGLSFVAFSPILIRLAPMSNNDPMVFFFIFLTILFLIKFIKKQSIFNTIFLAIGIGLAMASKLSGALIAVPTAAIFLCFFIKFLIRKEYKKILLFVLFAAICFPLALYWPIYNLLNYGQPLNYVFSNLNNKLAVPETVSYLDRFLIFRLDEYFNNIWMQLWAGAKDPQITNFYAAMIKSSIFGEFSYSGLSAGFAMVLYIINFILLLTIIFIGGYICLNLFKSKKYTLLLILLGPIFLYFIIVLVYSKITYMYIIACALIIALISYIYLYFKEIKHNFFNYKFESLFALIFLVFLVSYFTFQTQYKYTCTLDFRYVALFPLIGGYAISTFLSKSKNKEINIVLNTILGIYLSASYLLYFFVGL